MIYSYVDIIVTDYGYIHEDNVFQQFADTYVREISRRQQIFGSEILMIGLWKFLTL